MEEQASRRHPKVINVREAPAFETGKGRVRGIFRADSTIDYYDGEETD